MLTYNLEQRNDEPKYYYIYKMIRKDIEADSGRAAWGQPDHGGEFVSDVKGRRLH